MAQRRVLALFLAGLLVVLVLCGGVYTQDEAPATDTVRYFGKDYAREELESLLDRADPSPGLDTKEFVVHCGRPDPGHALRNELSRLLKKRYSDVMEYYRLTSKDVMAIDAGGDPQRWSRYSFQPRFTFELIPSAEAFAEQKRRCGYRMGIGLQLPTAGGEGATPPPIAVYFRDEQEVTSVLPGAVWGMAATMERFAAPMSLSGWVSTGGNVMLATMTTNRKPVDTANLLDDFLLHYWFSKVGTRAGPSLVDLMHGNLPAVLIPYEAWPVFALLGRRRRGAEVRELVRGLMLYAHMQNRFPGGGSNIEARRGWAMRFLKGRYGEQDEFELEMLSHLFEDAGPDILKLTAENLPWRGPPEEGLEEALGAMMGASSFDPGSFLKYAYPAYLGAGIEVPRELSQQFKPFDQGMMAYPTSRGLWQLFGILAYWRWLELERWKGREEEAVDIMEQLKQRLEQEGFSNLAQQAQKLFEERAGSTEGESPPWVAYLESPGRTGVKDSRYDRIPKREYKGVQLGGVRATYKVTDHKQDSYMGEWRFRCQVVNRTRETLADVDVWVMVFNSSGQLMYDYAANFHDMRPGAQERIDYEGTFSMKEQTPRRARIVTSSPTPWGEAYITEIPSVSFR